MRVVMAIAAGLALSPSAWACGQSTHHWVAMHALEHVPPSGALHDLLFDPEAQPFMRLGAMFPDGGYSPLTDHPYGETAHWEPFQTTYLEWIAAERGGLTAQSKHHVALDLGLAAHGLADQIFDGVYLTLSAEKDPEGWARVGNVDLYTDVAMTSMVGAQVPPEGVDLPWDELVEVFGRDGVEVDAGTLRTGMASLVAAITYTSNLGTDAQTAAEYLEAYPWTNAHLVDATVPGSPACIGEVVVAYWQTMLDRLDGTFDPNAQWVLATMPSDGAYEHPASALSLDSRVSIVFARAIDEATLDAGSVVVTDTGGRVHPTEHGLYYGNRSNVLNVWPLEDWAEGETYTVTVQPGLMSFDGDRLDDPWVFTFATGPAPTGGCDLGGAGPLPWLWLTLLLWRRSP